ncbi:oxygenase MpaB family protein [Mycobacterium sp. PDNC021]|uniref:oxygenase MpaB family protein n=1 Tax=Mycobacterium sp. PDNC021 TaxID=3391399 RepID=UPI003AADD639
MTCPVNQASITSPAPESISLDHDGAAPACTDGVDRFERISGSAFIGLFAAALLDQTMMPAVSAALEETGRIRNTPVPRGLRTATSAQIVFSGDAADRREESARLLRLHRDVKGVDAGGNRYSALNPELWNWILISTFFMYRNAAVVISGMDFTDADNQAVWNHFREDVTDLQLPGRSRLVSDYRDLCNYYDNMVANRLAATPTLETATSSLLHPPRPDFVPIMAAPAWALVGPVAGHLAAVLGFGVMHPGARALVPMKWTWRHDLEFSALSFLMRSAYRILPVAITDTPLTRARRKYEKLITAYKGIGLTSFAPDHPRDGVSAASDICARS